MIVDPSADEILDAVTKWLGELAATPSGGDAYLTRVAATALAIVRRELAQAPVADLEEAARLRELLGREGSLDELNADLCDALRERNLDETTPNLIQHLKQTALKRIEIDQPQYRSPPPGRS